MISFSGGVSLSYKLGKKLSVQSGLFYSSVENQIEGIASYTGFRRYDYSKGTDNFEVITSNGNILTENADVFLIDRAGDRVITVYSNDVFDPDKANLTYADNALYQNFSYMEIPGIPEIQTD